MFHFYTPWKRQKTFDFAKIGQRAPFYEDVKFNSL